MAWRWIERVAGRKRFTVEERGTGRTATRLIPSGTPSPLEALSDAYSQQNVLELHQNS